MSVPIVQPDLSWAPMLEASSSRDELVFVPWFTADGEVVTTVSEAPTPAHAVVHAVGEDDV